MSYLQEQKCLHHQSLPQHEGQLTKSGGLEHTAQPAGISAGETVSFPSDSVNLWFLLLPGSWTGQSLFGSLAPQRVSLAAFIVYSWKGGAS